MRMGAKGKYGRFFQYVGYGVLVVLTLVTLFYVGENWRGAREWSVVSSALAEAGLKGGGPDLLPPVPDAENFCMVPVLKRQFETPEKYRGLDISVGGGWFPGEVWMDVREKRTVYELEMEDWKKRLKPLEGQLEELRAAAGLRYSRFPGSGEECFAWSSIRGVISFSGALGLDTLLKVREGKGEEALRSMDAFCRIDEAFVGYRLSASPVLRAYNWNLMMEAIRLGLEKRLWDARQVEQIQGRLAGVDLLSAYKQLVVFELVTKMPQDVEEQRLRYVGMSGGAFFRELPHQLWLRVSNYLATGKWNSQGAWFNKFKRFLMPAGWWDHNRTIMAREALKLNKSFNSRDFLEWAEGYNEQWWVDVNGSQYEDVGRGMIRSVYRSFAVILTVQSGLLQAETACALERYYMEKGEYPERLEALVPEYMREAGRDSIEGEPLRYARTEEGRYRIYSVGWNGKDEDGARDRQHRMFAMHRAKDWVWEYGGGMSESVSLTGGESRINQDAPVTATTSGK